MVLITGVQGSGKTFLARLLVNDLKKNESKREMFWISNLTELRELQTKSIKEMNIYVFDGVFYELQTDKKLREAVKVLEFFLNKNEKPFVILTSPTYIWQKLATREGFQARFRDVHINLDKRNESEKRDLLKYLMKRYDVSKEEAENLCKRQDNLLQTAYENIGFPALISWVCKQSSEQSIDTLVGYPLQSICDKVASLKNASSVEERGKYLILAYVGFKDGKMNVKNVDEELFNILKTKYVPGFQNENLEGYVYSMERYYLSKNEDGCFEFDLNIMKKIVLVSIAMDDVVFFQKHCNRIYPQYVIPKEDCPLDIEASYAGCFTRI